MVGKMSYALGLAAVLATGCLTNVPQHKNSGKDQRTKGARKFKVEDGEGRSRRDVVTYPGGDRIDYWSFKLPEGNRGTLTVKVKFKPPRPGLDVAFRLYDEYFARLGHAKPTPDSGKRSKKIKVKNAEAGLTYYVQVYAPRRLDAGRYQISVRYNESKTKVAAGPTIVVDDLPDPPKLPAIPDVEPPADPVPCPNDPSRMQPNCEDAPPPKVDPIPARVVKFQVSGSGAVIITVDKGKNAGIEQGWVGKVVNSAGKTVDGGEFKVTKVTSGEAVGKVQLSVDQIRANRKVVLTPQ
jgi:hypothetical protein